MARFWCIIWVCTCNFAISIWSSPNATYKATANKYFWNQLAPQIMHQNLAVMLRQFCYSKISFIVFVPGPIPSAPPSYEEAMKIGNSPIHDFPPPYSPTAPPVPDSDDPRSTSIWRSLWPSPCSQSSSRPQCNPWRSRSRPQSQISLTTILKHTFKMSLIRTLEVTSFCEKLINIFCKNETLDDL